MVCLTWPHLANWAEIYNAAGRLQRAASVIPPARLCLCRPSLNIWGAHVGMNGGAGFRHKAVKGESAGGHFNSSVNTTRSHLSATQQTADRRRSERRWRLLSGRAQRLSENVFEGANRLWTSFLIPSGVSRVTRRGKITEGDTRQIWCNNKAHWTIATGAAAAAQRAKQLRLHSLVHPAISFLCLQCHYVTSRGTNEAPSNIFSIRLEEESPTTGSADVMEDISRCISKTLFLLPERFLWFISRFPIFPPRTRPVPTQLAVSDRTCGSFHASTRSDSTSGGLGRQLVLCGFLFTQPACLSVDVQLVTSLSTCLTRRASVQEERRNCTEY